MRVWLMLYAPIIWFFSVFFFFFSSRRRHTRLVSDWSSDVCSSDLDPIQEGGSSPRGVGRPSLLRKLAGLPCRSCLEKSARVAWISDTARSCSRLRLVDNRDSLCALRRNEKLEACRCDATRSEEHTS